jgi:hypothetical protein
MANDPPFATLNHAASDSRIPRESNNQRFGISAPLHNFLGNGIRRITAVACSCVPVVASLTNSNHMRMDEGVANVR